MLKSDVLNTGMKAAGCSRCYKMALQMLAISASVSLMSAFRCWVVGCWKTDNNKLLETKSVANFNIIFL